MWLVKVRVVQQVEKLCAKPEFNPLSYLLVLYEGHVGVEVFRSEELVASLCRERSSNYRTSSGIRDGREIAGVQAVLVWIATRWLGATQEIGVHRAPIEIGV